MSGRILSTVLRPDSGRIGATKRCARPPAAAGWTRTRRRTASGAPPAGPSMTTAS